MTKTTYYKGKTVCLNCGTEVIELVSKKGFNYVAEIRIWHGDYGSKPLYPSHRCDLWDVNDSSLGFQERAIAQGEIITGAVVKVVKGRKVPVGTIAKVFWVGCTNFGISVGLQLDDGTRVFTAITNLEPMVSQLVA